MPELTTEKSVLLTDLALCVNRYRLFTPGIYVCLHVPVLLDENTRIVPGLIAMVNHGRLKQCKPVTLGFEGPPNFVLDVFDLPRFHPYSFYSSARDNVGKIRNAPRNTGRSHHVLRLGMAESGRARGRRRRWVTAGKQKRPWPTLFGDGETRSQVVQAEY